VRQRQTPWALRRRSFGRHGGVENLASSWQDPSALKEARLGLERRMVREALEQTGHNVQAAARRPGMSRMSTYPLLERYDIDGQRPAPQPTAAGSVV
jgi:DNA-binding NtrC family response regulator